jgi:hypothetical protein
MPLPEFNIDGVLSPFMGADGPGGHFEDLSPYKVSVLEVVQGLSSTDGRKTILRGWLLHRKRLGRLDSRMDFSGSMEVSSKETRSRRISTS